MQLSGIKAHIFQRISAIYLLIFFPYLAWQIFQNTRHEEQDFQSWLNELFDPLLSLTSVAAVILILIHAWVGIRDIIIDYLPPERVSIALKLYAGLLIMICIDLLWLTYWLLLTPH